MTAQKETKKRAQVWTLAWLTNFLGTSQNSGPPYQHAARPKVSPSIFTFQNRMTAQKKKRKKEVRRQNRKFSESSVLMAWVTMLCQVLVELLGIRAWRKAIASWCLGFPKVVVAETNCTRNAS